MKDLITKILNEELTQKLSSQVILLFKLLQSKKKELKSKKNIIEFLEKRLRVIGIDPKEAQRYYYLYTLNYRENGDYENIPPDELVNEKNFPSPKVTNVTAGKYAYAKMPFEGSNLTGYWSKDRKGVEQYVITSYGWYPILVYKNGKWHSVIERYSRSTSKQYSNATREGIYNTIPLRNKDIKRLVNGDTLDEIQNNRINEFMEDYTERIKGESFYGFMSFVINNSPQNISFDCIVTDIELRDGKVVIGANVKLKSKYRDIELTDEQKREVEKYFKSMVFVRTKILNPEDVEINVTFVD